MFIMGARTMLHQFLSSDEKAKLIAEQRIRSRRERLLQVRRQDTILAAVRLKEFRAQVAAGQQKLAQQLEAQWRADHQQKIAALEAELAAALADVGRSQRQAQEAVAEKAQRAEAAAIQAEENWRNAQARFAGALREEQVRRDELQANHRAAAARRAAVEENTRVERALARIAAQNAEIRQRAEEAAAATREPLVLPDFDGPDAFRHTHLHQQLLERIPLTNIPGAENAPPKQVVKFAPPEILIKGLDDSRVAAEVERRRVEAGRERRERERREAHSRTVEREAAAQFRVSVWRQRKESALALALARRAQALEAQRALSPEDESVTSLIQHQAPEPAAGQPQNDSQTRTEGEPSEPAGARPDLAATDVRTTTKDSPSPVAVMVQHPKTPAATTDRPAANLGPSEAPSETLNLGASEMPPAAQRPKAPVSVSEVPRRSQPESADWRDHGLDEAQESIGRTEAGPGGQAGANIDERGGIALAVNDTPSEGANTDVRVEDQNAADGGQGSGRGMGGWLPRIGEDSPFVERRAHARDPDDLRQPLEALLESARLEGTVSNGTGPEGKAIDGAVAPGREPSPDNPEEVAGMGLREVLEQLVALEAARNETGRASEMDAALQRLGNAGEGSQASFAAGKAGGDDLRQSLEEFMALERELYDREQRGARFRGRANANQRLPGFGGLRREEGRGANAASLEGFGGVGSGGEITREPEMEGRNPVTSSTTDGDVSRSAEPVENSSFGLAFEGRGLDDRRRLAVSAARQPLGYAGLDYASSDFTLMSSPTSGLSPFSLMTSPLSNFSESDLDALLEEDLLGVHVSSFELGHVSEEMGAQLGSEGPSQSLDLTVGQELGFIGAGSLTSVAEPSQNGRSPGLMEGGTYSATGAEQAVGRSATGNQNRSQVADSLADTFAPSGASLQMTASAEATSQVDSLTTGLSGFGLSSALFSSDSHGTRSGERTSDRDSGGRWLNSRLTAHVMASSGDTLYTTTGRSESFADPGSSSRDSQPTVPIDPTVPVFFQPSSQTVPAPLGLAPGFLEPVQDSSQSDPVVMGQNRLGELQPTAREQGPSRPNETTTDHLLPGAQGRAGQLQQPVDDRFARLKRELDEFDERLFAVRANAFAPQGKATQILSTVYAGFSSTTSTSASDAQPSATVIPLSGSITAGLPLGPTVPGAPTGIADVVTTSAGTGASGVSLTVSSLSLTSLSSPVSQTLPLNQAPNPVSKPFGSSDLETDLVAPPLNPFPEETEEPTLAFGDNLVANASWTSLEGRPPSISAALGFSETSSEESDAADRAAELSGLDSLGEREPDFAVRSSGPETLAVDGREVEGGDSETPSRLGVNSQTQENSVLGESGFGLEGGEQLFFSDQSLTTTWQSRSSTLLAAPGAQWARERLATAAGEWLEGFRGLGGESPASDAGVGPPQETRVKQTFGGEWEGENVGDEQRVETEEADRFTVPLEHRVQAGLHLEALSNAPFPSEPVSRLENSLPNPSISQEMTEVLSPATGKSLQRSLSPPLVVPELYANSRTHAPDQSASPSLPGTQWPPSDLSEKLLRHAPSFPPAFPKPPNLFDEPSDSFTGRSPVEPLPAHFAEDLLRSSLLPPSAAPKPPNLAAALALLDRPVGLLTFDEQLESLAAELRKLDHRLCAVTSQSVGSLFDSGLSTSYGDGNGNGGGDGNGTSLRGLYGDLGNEGSAAAAVTARMIADSDGAMEKGDISSPQRAFRGDGDPHLGEADVSSSLLVNDDAVAGQGPGPERPADGSGADVSGRMARGDVDVKNSPCDETPDGFVDQRQIGAEASGESSGASGSEVSTEPERSFRTGPESSASPGVERTSRPSAAETARVDFASLSSVGWAAALDIDGPDSLLAGSVDFSPWHGSEVSEPSLGIAGAVRIGTELRQPDVNNLIVTPAGDNVQDYTSGGSAISSPSQSHVAVGGAQIPLLDADSGTDGAERESDGVGFERKPDESVGKQTATRKENRTTGPQKASSQSLRLSARVPGPSSIRPTVAKRKARAPKPAIQGGAGAAARSAPPRALESSSHVDALPAGAADEEPVQQTGALGESPVMSNPLGGVYGSGGRDNVQTDRAGGGAHGPEAVRTPVHARQESGRNPFADPARSPSGRLSGPPTPSSVTSSWSSFASGKSARGEEPVRRYEASLREGGDRGGRPGSKREAEKRKRAKELKDRARAFDKEQRQRRQEKKNVVH